MNIFKKFEGLKVRVQMVNGFGLPVDHHGYVETDENWAYLYEKGQKGNRYILAIKPARTAWCRLKLLTGKRSI